MVSNKLKLSDVMEQITLLKDIFEQVRIVDPIKKIVIYADDMQLKELDIHCYEFWHDSKVCENCVSIRAYNEQKTVIKLVFNENKLYLLVATPIMSEDRVVILEFMEDVTDAQLIDNIDVSRPIDLVKYLKNTDDRLIRDELTNVYNKRFINERLPYEIFNSMTNNKPLSIIMADIDYFKDINDKNGHVFGDYVIKEFARELSRAIRQDIDWIARYGGDEFLIFLKETNQKDAYIIAERMRKSIEKIELQLDNEIIKMTASFGICTIITDTPIDELIDCADKNLYYAKKNGKNTVQ